MYLLKIYQWRQCIPISHRDKQMAQLILEPWCSSLWEIEVQYIFCSLVKCFDRNSQNNIRTFNNSFNTHVFRCTQVQISPLYTHSVNWLIEHLFYGIRNSRTGFSSAICSFPYKLKFTNYLLLSCFFNNLLVHPENVKILLSFQNLHNTHHCILSSATWANLSLQ